MSDSQPPTNRSSVLAEFLTREWDRTLIEYPLLASELGKASGNDRWPDLSLEGFERRNAANRDALARLAKFDESQLSESDQLNRKLYCRKCEEAIDELGLQWHLLPLNAREGIQNANAIADCQTFAAERDYEDWLGRLESFPKYMDQTIALMREGIKTGMVHSKVVMQRLPAQINAQVVDDAEQSLFFKPFRSIPDDFDAPLRERLTKQAVTAVNGCIVPAYRKMRRFFTEEYLQACYDDVGVWQLPRGREIYEFFARKFTTTDYSPEEIHDIGLREVERIRKEMLDIIDLTEFSGSFDQFINYLRSDRQFYHTTADGLMNAYRECCQRIDSQLSRLFHRVPKVWYDLQPISANIAPDTTAAYYRPLSADGKRLGTYFVNLYKPEVRPTYEIEALSLHEAVPGHHLQIALAMELDDLPEFRRYAPEGEYTGYVEGWALYAESLGKELGCYKDPVSKFGQLTYDIWRAIRLVVDTGIHVFKWPRDRAIGFFAKNSAKSLHDIENEIDRYIAWPGQAVAYKIGELKIREMRETLAAEQGEEFELRHFHERILANGPLPLDILRSFVLK